MHIKSTSKAPLTAKLCQVFWAEIGQMSRSEGQKRSKWFGP